MSFTESRKQFFHHNTSRHVNSQANSSPATSILEHIRLPLRHRDVAGGLQVFPITDLYFLSG